MRFLTEEQIQNLILIIFYAQRLNSGKSNETNQEQKLT